MALTTIEPAPLSVERPAGITLLSDLHIGASTFAEEKLREDVELARRRKDRVLVNGDVFDAILFGDAKRYLPSALHSRLYGSDDLLGDSVRWGVEIFRPIANQIDMIGVGNHETSVIKHRAFDPVAALIESLNSYRKTQPIPHGGYTGLVHYSFTKAKRPSPQRGFTLGYWHGAGGGGSLGGAMGELTHKGSWIEGLDLLWFAHRHVRMVSQVQRFCWQRRKLRNVWLVRTGAYLNSYESKPGSSRKQGDYASDALHAPYGLGGLRVVLSPTGEARVEVE